MPPVVNHLFVNGSYTIHGDVWYNPIFNQEDIIAEDWVLLP